MRLWTLHPSLLDSKGLVALWREALGAQAALHGKTQGYNKHPQLERWRGHDASFEAYLECIVWEADKRDYSFNRTKIITNKGIVRWHIPVSIGQVKYELNHLLNKLQQRDTNQLLKVQAIINEQKDFEYLINPIFTIKHDNANIESWERVK